MGHDSTIALPMPAARVTVPEESAQSIRVDNPYAGAVPYVNPDWSANVVASAAQAGGELGRQMSAVAGQPTAVWLDQLADVGRLRGHLDRALALQQARRVTVVITLVLYSLPDRDCRRVNANGDLFVNQDGLNRYRTEFVDPIAATLADPRYARLRVVSVVEPNSLTQLASDYESSYRCQLVRQSQAYETGIAYALNKFQPLSNVYSYVDLGHSGEVGWAESKSRLLAHITSVAGRTAAGTGSVHGFANNVAGYTPTVEPYLTIDQVISGQPIRYTRFYDFGDHADEAGYLADMYARLVSTGFPPSIGFLHDTSRNGWGGPARPTGPSTSTDPNRYVNETRIDRRPLRSWWCNQIGAGLGARYRANPAAHIDAQMWIKPPGESDGWLNPLDVNERGQYVPPGVDDPGRRTDAQCVPNAYWPNDRGSSYATNAMDGAPPPAQWFPAQFEQLVRNAHPPLA